MQSREWSAKNSNLAIDQEQVYQGYRSVIVTVSRESGLEHFSIYDQAITTEEFKDHLKRLRKKNGKVPLALFMDQLNVHRGKDVKPKYTEHDITPIYNIGYSPELNPIEAVFSQVKRVFVRERLRSLVNGEVFDMDLHIKTALAKITRELVEACVRKSLALMKTVK